MSLLNPHFISLLICQALHYCEHYRCYEEMVYILRKLCLIFEIKRRHSHPMFTGEMGNPIGALRLIINTLGDVEKVHTQFLKCG